MFDDNPSYGILHSEEHLTTGYTPDEPVGRDREIERMAAALRPLAQGRSPTHLLVHGPGGVGKSVCVAHVLERLEVEAGVKTVYINCWQYNTRPSFLAQLLIELGYPAPRKGKPVDELLAKLREWVDKNRSLAVGLDEFDKLNGQTEVIYDLHHIRETAAHQVGLLLVSNEPPSNIQLNPRSESRLTCHTLTFQPYTRNHLVDILAPRVEQAFRPGTVSDGLLEHIADTVADRSGDCRQALELLLHAGRKADQEHADRVTAEHVEQLQPQSSD